MQAEPGFSLRRRIREDPSLIDTLRTRSRIFRSIRSFFDLRDFLEVTTPSLVTTADPAVHLESFRTELHENGRRIKPLFLPTSPEYHMKRLVAAGMERIYQIGPFFRNGELTPLHNPDFTGLEWYQTGAGVEETMSLTEEMVREVAWTVLGTRMLRRAGHKVDLAPPFRRLSVHRAVAEIADIELPEDFEETKTRSVLRRAGIHLAPDDRFDDMIHRVLLERVEPALADMGPTFLHDYPAQMAALARLRPDRPWVAERFELYAGGLELCNGYGELVNAREQRRRFMAQCAERRSLGKPVPDLDEAFLGALEEGLPECSGCALGLDRLVMLLCGKETLDQVMAFPLAIELRLTTDGA